MAYWFEVVFHGGCLPDSPSLSSIILLHAEIEDATSLLGVMHGRTGKKRDRGGEARVSFRRFCQISIRAYSVAVARVVPLWNVLAYFRTERQRSSW